MTTTENPKPRGRNGGRKPKHGVALSERIDIRLTPDLYGLLAAFAEQDGQNLQEYCRGILSKHAVGRLVV